jgi:hypothetical protein
MRMDYLRRKLLLSNINSVRSSQETHYVSAAEPNRLMLFGETVAVCCENRTGNVKQSAVAERRTIFNVTAYSYSSAAE